MNDAYGMQKLQEVNLSILKEIDRICEKYKIKYTLDAGTLLGAIRHGGFIGWDDDADVAMTRNNFMLFKKVVARELPTGMRLVMPADLPNGAFYDFTPRIIYEASSRRETDAESAYYGEYLNHMWVDIFILDALPDGSTGKCMLAVQKLLYALSMGHRYMIDYKKYGISLGILIRFFGFFGKLFPMKLLIFLQESVSRKYNKKKTKYVYYSNYQPDYLHVKLKREWVAQYSEILFEDTKLCIVDAYDQVLKTVYGDYMTLPPKEKRVPTHQSTEIKIYG